MAGLSRHVALVPGYATTRAWRWWVRSAPRAGPPPTSSRARGRSAAPLLTRSREPRPSEGNSRSSTRRSSWTRIPIAPFQRLRRRASRPAQGAGGHRGVDAPRRPHRHAAPNRPREVRGFAASGAGAPPSLVRGGQHGSPASHSRLLAARCRQRRLRSGELGGLGPPDRFGALCDVPVGGGDDGDPHAAGPSAHQGDRGVPGTANLSPARLRRPEPARAVGGGARVRRSPDPYRRGAWWP